MLELTRDDAALGSPALDVPDPVPRDSMVLSESLMKRRPRQVEIVLAPPGGPAALDFHELWAARETLHAMVGQILKVRYAHTAIGAGWAILQPLSLMVVFTIFMGMLVRMPSDGLPYALFVYCALIFWQFASHGFLVGSASVVQNVSLVTKVYFPRILLPLSVIIAGLADLMFALPALAALMIYFGVAPDWHIVLLPFFLLLAVVTVLGLTLWGATLNVMYRDVSHLLPFLAQIWMFSTPVIYPLSVVPEKFHGFYALNPLVSVVQGSRWIFAGGAPPSLLMLAASSFTALALLVTGYIYFRRREALFPDIL